jgi:hypothetical protein
VASEGGEASPAAQQSGATSGGTTTDDQTSGNATAESAPEEQPPTADHEGEDTAAPADDADGDTGTGPGAPGPNRTAPQSTADRPEDGVKADQAVPGTPDETTGVTPAEKADEKSTKTAGGSGTVSAGEAATEVLEPAREAGGTAGHKPSQEPAATPGTRAAPRTRRELHSGHKLARRYQLEECVTRVDGFSSWRAVDEKLRRAVGIHILPADHGRARQVLAAARSAALLGDPRFVQVLDAVEENDLVYVIHEWLPHASSLADLLAAGPLEPHEAYQMVSQVSQGMSAAHREGLAHLRLDPGSVLRTVSGQYRIRGLAVAAALRGLSSDRPQRQDTEAIGALLYASLTQRWPYAEDAHGLAGLPKSVGLVAPDQVRAGVHRGLSELAMRALVNDGATASREDPPCTTPEELAKAVAGVPRIRPEQAAPVYPPTAFQQPAAPVRGATRVPPAAPPVPPPALPGRTGQALKWAVFALLIVAIGLGSWQLADALKSRENHTPRSTPTGQKAGQQPTTPAARPIDIVGVKDFDPNGDGSETPSEVHNVDDHNVKTYWQTSWYETADLGGLKPGVGVILDLGSAKNVSNVTITFIGATTSVELRAAAGDSTARPTQLQGFPEVASNANAGTTVTLTPSTKVKTRYLLVWLTKLPQTPDGKYRGKIAEIHVTG